MFQKRDFALSENLSKALPMPDWRRWRVCDADRKVEGQVQVYLRAKGFFFDKVSSQRPRYCCLTNRGYLMVYTGLDKGYVLDMKIVKAIRCKIDNKKHRCNLKLRFKFGTLNFCLEREAIHEWREALISAADVDRSVPLPDDGCHDEKATYRPLPICQNASAILSATEDTMLSPPNKTATYSMCNLYEEENENDGDTTYTVEEPMSETEASEVTATTVEPITQIPVSSAWFPGHRKNSTDVSSTSDSKSKTDSVIESGIEVDDDNSSDHSGLFSYIEQKSVRQPPVSVGWLRRQLEQRIRYEQMKEEKETKMARVIPRDNDKYKVSEAHPTRHSIEDRSPTFEAFQYWRSESNV